MSFCKTTDQNQKMRMIRMKLARQRAALLAGLLALPVAMNGAKFSTTTTWILEMALIRTSSILLEKRMCIELRSPAPGR